jgi:hypothetical protein
MQNLNRQDAKDAKRRGERRKEKEKSLTTEAQRTQREGIFIRMSEPL